MPRRIRIGYPRAVRMAGEWTSFALSGHDASLKRGLKVTADQSSYAVTGQDATLSTTGAPSVGALSTSFTLTSASSGTLPFTIGHAFKQGDLPSGNSISGIQCNVISTWPDVSAKFAVLSGTASLTANVPSTIPLSIGTAAAGTTRTTTHLQSAMSQTLTIDCGAFGSVSWSGTDWLSPLRAWVTGPVMSSWIFRKTIGGDAHFRAYLEVRLWSSGHVEVLPYLENGFVGVSPGPSTKDATFTVTYGATTWFSDRPWITMLTHSYNGSNTFSTGAAGGGGSVGSVIRVRSGASWGTATTTSWDGNNATFSVVWDSTIPSTLTSIDMMGLPGYCRTPLVSGSAVSHWVGTNPGITPSHDRPYLRETKLVPNYPRSLSAAGSSYITSMTNNFTPLSRGLYPNGIGSGGYHASIGLLPAWDAAYLANTDSTVPFVEVQHQAYRHGRYGIHIRDVNTDKPARCSDWPTTVFRGNNIGASGASTTNSYTASITGIHAPYWKVSHHPSAGFVAALLTGRHYHVETCQFTASIVSLFQSNLLRDNGNGTLRLQAYMETRGFGWGLRTLAQAVSLSHDMALDPTANLQDEYKTHINNTVAYNAARYTTTYADATPRYNNPLGWLEPYNLNGRDGYTNGQDPHTGAPWMHDFVTMSVGYLRHCLPDLGANQPKIVAWYDYLGKGVVGRFGSIASDQWLYRDAASYCFSMAPVDTSDGTAGPWYTNWGEAWDQTWLAPTGGRAQVWSQNPGTVAPRVRELGDGSLRGDLPNAYGSYWMNMQPALAYCVEHGVTGASSAWSLYTSAPNYESGIGGYFASHQPEWGVFPRNIGFASGSGTGTYVNNGSSPDLWTPARDANGVVTQASWNTVPTGRWVEVNDTKITSLTTAVLAATSGWDSGKLWTNTDLFNTWAGMTIDQAGARGWFFGGGHGDGDNNGLYRFDFYKMGWSVECMPSNRSAWPAEYTSSGSKTIYDPNDRAAWDKYQAGQLSPTNDIWYDEDNAGKPTGRHTYNSLAYVSTENAVYMSCRRLWRFNLTTGTWDYKRVQNDQIIPYASGYNDPGNFLLTSGMGGTHCILHYDEVAGDLLMHGVETPTGRFRFNLASKNGSPWSVWNAPFPNNYGHVCPARHSRKVAYFIPPRGDIATYGRYSRVDLDTGVVEGTAGGTNWTLASGVVASDFPANLDGSTACYIPSLNRYWWLVKNNSGNVWYEVNPTTTPWTLSKKTFTNAMSTVSTQKPDHLHYLEGLSAVAMIDSASRNLFIYKF